MKKTFDKPLDQIVNEEREVERLSFEIDPDTGSVTPKTVTQTIVEPTIYTRAKKRFFSCADGKHSWFMADRHRHIAKCRKCSKHRFLRAPYERINKDGHIVDRDTGDIID